MRLATSRFLGRPRNFVVNALRRQERQRGRPGQRLVVRRSRRTIRTTGSTRRSRSGRSRRTSSRRSASCSATTSGCSGWPAATTRGRSDFLNIQQMFHDVYYTRFTRLDNGEVESWDLYVTLLDWHLKLRRQPPRHVRLQPHLRAAVRAVRDFAGRDPAAGRVPLHALQEQSAVDGHEAAAVGQRQPDVRQLLVGQGRAGDDEPHLQAAAAVHGQREHQPDVCAAAGRALHRAHLHVERQLRRVAVGCRSRT